MNNLWRCLDSQNDIQCESKRSPNSSISKRGKTRNYRTKCQIEDGFSITEDMEMHIAISKGFDYDMKGCKRNLIVLINSIDGIVDYVENKVNFLVVQKLK